jgi:hypothetical protein
MALSATRTESSGLREFLNSSRGRTVSFAAVILMLVAAGFLVWRAMAPSDAQAIARDHVFMDSKTMKPFSHELKMGDHIPCDAPSGGKTGYPAELCYWTKDGQVRKDPYPVLLNSWIGKSGPTFCPDCGRLVVGHNPEPKPSGKAPPTEAEYKARGGGGSSPSHDGRSEIRHTESRHEIRIVLR